MKAKMKTSPSSSCSSSSSSSSCVGSDSSPHQQQQRPDKPKTKKAKTDKNYSDKCQNANATSPNAGRRSSIYRGVTRHRWTGRFEAHLWDKSSWNSIQNKKGKQVYLGAYDSEEAAARTYDLAALKYWGPETTLNFPIDTYTTEIQEMAKVSKEEYLASLRRRSSGFSRGVSKYRGVARHHHNGRWEARIGRVFGNKYLYLGTYNTQEEAAAAYDMAAIEYRGANAVTNFDISNYIDRLQKKGILPPSLANQTQTQNPTPNSSVKSEEAEPEVKQQQQDQQLQYSQFPQCMDSATVVDSNELAWSFCVDPGFTPFLDPDFSLDKPLELPDLFADIGFEDNIDMIFDAGCGADGVGVSGNMEDNIKERSSSSSSESDTTMLSSSTGASPSSSSTTTSISC